MDIIDHIGNLNLGRHFLCSLKLMDQSMERIEVISEGMESISEVLV